MGGIIEITKSPWSTVEDETPAIGPREFALRIAAAPAENGERPTVAILGAYRLPGPYGLIYGSRIRGALRVVAIDVQTGALFFNHAEPMHAEPIEVVMNPDAKPNPGEPVLVAVEGYFNFDLCKQLGLPPEKSEYLVFAWLDDITSESLVPLVPEDKQRPRSMAAPGRVNPPVVKFGQPPQSPKTTESSIQMHAAHLAGPGPHFSEITLFGAVAPKLLPERPPGKDEPSTFLTLMAVGSRNRVVRWHSIDLTDEMIEWRECFFELNLGLLVDQTNPPQKAFVIAVVGTTKSEVLVVDPLHPQKMP